MSLLPWNAIEVDAAQHGRDVIELSLTISDCSDEAEDRLTDELVAALQRLIYSLDDSWKGSRRKPPAAIPSTYTFFETVRGYNSIRLFSSGTADLFGITPVTRSAGRTAQLLSAVRDLEKLQDQLAAMSVGTVMAFERFLRELLEIPASMRMEWAAPCGERGSVTLDVQEALSVSSLIHEVAITEQIVQVKGSLSAINPARKTFSFISQDGKAYKGRLSDPIRQQYILDNDTIQLPAKAEAVIERRVIFQKIIHTESVVDTLLELDTNTGLDVEETLFALKELFGRLEVFTESDAEFDSGRIISLADYSELAKLIDELICSHPAKGARRLLNLSDITEATELLAAGKPICRLVEFNARLLPFHQHDEDEFNQSSTLYKDQKKHSDKLAKLLADAYPDFVKLQKQMSNMIQALENTQK